MEERIPTWMHSTVQRDLWSVTVHVEQSEKEQAA